MWGKSHLIPDDDESRLGDFWTWLALDPETKLVPHHHFGNRNEDEAVIFARELRRRAGLTDRVWTLTDLVMLPY